MNLRKLLVISIPALIVCIASAVFAENITASDSMGRSEWERFDDAIWITLLVTVPTFSIFIVTAMMAIVIGIRKTIQK